MIRFVFLLSAFIALAQGLCGQKWERRVDSLRREAAICPSDSERAGLYLDLLNAFRNRDIDSAYHYGHAALRLARERSYKPREGAALGSLASIYLLDEKYEECIEYNKNAMTVFQELGNDRGVGAVYHSLGLLYMDKAKYDSALVYLQNALVYMKRAGSPYDISTMHSGLSSYYYGTANFAQALYHMARASEIRDSLGHKRGAAVLKGNIAVIHTKMGNFEQALKYFFEVLEFRKELNDIRGQASVFANIAGTFNGVGKLDSAWKYGQLALNTAREIKSEGLEARTLITLGSVKRKQGRYAEAEQLLKRAIEIKDRIGQVKNRAEMLLELGEVYEKTGEFLKGAKIVEKAISDAKETGESDFVREGYFLLAKISGQSGDFEKAYMAMQEFKEMQDSIMGEQVQAEIVRYQQKYESEKKQREIEQLQTQDALKAVEIEYRKTRAKYTWIGIAAGVIIFLLVLALLSNTLKLQKRARASLDRENLKLQQTNRTIQLEKENLELHAMLARMNPHFIFNSLNSIQRFITNHEQEAAHEYLHKFSLLIRTILDHSNKNWVPFSEVLEALQHYLALELARVNDKFDVELDIDPGIDVYNLMVPPLLIQPYVENAIWHGLMPLEGRKGKLRIHMQGGDGQIECMIEDNGIGRKRSQAEKPNPLPGQGSQGMQITLKRLKSLWAQRGEVKEVKITDLYNSERLALGTRVELVIPIDF